MEVHELIERAGQWPTATLAMVKPRPFWRQPLTWLLACVVLAFAGIAVLRACEPDPIEYRNVPFPVPETVRAGEPLPMTIERCVSDEIVDFGYTRLLHSLEAGMNYALTDGTAIALPGCTRTLNLSVIVPIETVPGRYELVGVVRVQGNWREHKIVYKSAAFDVTR